MNVTPLIDILLVLLIIFMVVTPLRPVGLEAQVPQPSPSAPPPPGPDRTIVVTVGSDLTVTINSEPVELAALGARLTEIFRTRAERAVFVRAHRDVEFQNVARAIDIARSAGVERVGLLAAIPN